MRARLGPRVRRAVTLAVAVAWAVPLATAALALSRTASASVALPVKWHDLLARSTAAAFATPSETTSVWEDGRIWTYTRVTVDRSVAGSLPTGASAWIRTRGGVVGRIGQQVEGEAVFPVGRQSLVFLAPGPAGSYEVTERGQGQFAIEAGGDAGATPRIVHARSLGVILPPSAAGSASRTGTTPPALSRLADDVLRDRTVDEAVHAIAADWDRLHAP